MINKLFLDINIVLDLMDAKREHHSDALKLLEVVIMQDIEICISEDMLSTIYYISKDKKQALKFLKTITNRWDVVPFGEAVIREAIDFSQRNGHDFEDGLQCLCAKHNGCEVILTNDKRFADCGVKVIGYELFFSRKIP